MKKVFVKHRKIKEDLSTIKDFPFGTFPSISGSGSGYTLITKEDNSVLPEPEIFITYNY
jgi:hypothetical protein